MSKIDYRAPVTEEMQRLTANPPTKLPDDAMFPVPPVTTALWNDRAWVKWWIATGAQRLPTPEEKEAERLRLWNLLAGGTR